MGNQCSALTDTNNPCKVAACIESVTAHSSDSVSPTDTYTLKMKRFTTYRGESVKQAFLKVWINDESNTLTEAEIGALAYELRVSKEIINRLMEQNICNFFVQNLAGSITCSYNSIFNIVKLAFGANDNRNIEQHLFRNFDYMYNLRKNRPAVTAPLKEKEKSRVARFKGKIDQSTEFGFIINQLYPSPKVLTDMYDMYFTPTDVANTVFQIAYACLAMSHNFLTHGDMHEGNVFIVTAQPGTVIEINTERETVRFAPKYLVKIFDFDHAYSPDFGENFLLNNLSGIIADNCFIENRDIVYVFHCIQRLIVDWKDSEYMKVRAAMMRALIKPDLFSTIMAFMARKTTNRFFGVKDAALNTTSFPDRDTFFSSFRSTAEVVSIFAKEIEQVNREPTLILNLKRIGQRTSPPESLTPTPSQPRTPTQAVSPANVQGGSQPRTPTQAVSQSNVQGGSQPRTPTQAVSPANVQGGSQATPSMSAFDFLDQEPQYDDFTEEDFQLFPAAPEIVEIPDSSVVEEQSSLPFVQPQRVVTNKDYYRILVSPDLSSPGQSVEIVEQPPFLPVQTAPPPQTRVPSDSIVSSSGNSVQVISNSANPSPSFVSRFRPSIEIIETPIRSEDAGPAGNPPVVVEGRFKLPQIVEEKTPQEQSRPSVEIIEPPLKSAEVTEMSPFQPRVSTLSTLVEQQAPIPREFITEAKSPSRQVQFGLYAIREENPQQSFEESVAQPRKTSSSEKEEPYVIPRAVENPVYQIGLASKQTQAESPPVYDISSDSSSSRSISQSILTRQPLQRSISVSPPSSKSPDPIQQFISERVGSSRVESPLPTAESILNSPHSSTERPIERSVSISPVTSESILTREPLQRISRAASKSPDPIQQFISERVRSSRSDSPSQSLPTAESIMNSPHYSVSQSILTQRPLERSAVANEPIQQFISERVRNSRSELQAQPLPTAEILINSPPSRPRQMFPLMEFGDELRRDCLESTR